MKELQKRVYDLLRTDEHRSRGNRVVTVILVCLILLATVFVVIDSFSGLPLWWWRLSLVVNVALTVLFSVEYLLRLWTAPFIRPQLSPAKARLKYILSPMAVIDLLSILPFYLFLFTHIDIAALRTLRLLRLFVFFKFNRYFHTLDTIGSVVKLKRRELITSLVAVFSLMMISSALIYSIEGQVQPDKFTNVLSGLWWAISTLLTIGYGDIYPVTAAGKVLAAVVAVLGVGLIAVPTGIISAGFVEVMDNRRQQMDEKLAEAETARAQKPRQPRGKAAAGLPTQAPPHQKKTHGFVKNTRGRPQSRYQKKANGNREGTEHAESGR